jgi:tRNA A-37 threonylcarbamoyl transferase component Bud32
MSGLRTREPKLRIEELPDYLRGRGVLTGAYPVDAGVFTVDSGGTHVVVKQALSQLKVATTWEADPGRVVVEAEALRVAGAIAPGSVPAVYDLDTERHLLVMERAPAEFRNWKDDLLAGHVDTGVAARLGSLLAAWHAATTGRPGLVERFGDKTGFVELRVEPFYRSVTRKYPALRSRLNALSDRLLQRQVCLVHGDFSPKNVLTDGNREWVLDWEVAHLGDPVFDLAFLLTHLLTKALHRTGSARDYRAAGEAFLHGYCDSAPGPIDMPYLAAHIAALLLARVDGTSPVDYLDEPARRRARNVATAALRRRAITPDDIWEML